MKLREIAEDQFKPATKSHRRSNATNARTTPDIGDNTRPGAQEQPEQGQPQQKKKQKAQGATAGPPPGMSG